MAQSVVALEDAIFVGLGARPDQSLTEWIEVDPPNAHIGIGRALNDLPDGGGVLYVMPGSAPYRFGQALSVTKPNVTIRFAGGAVLGFPPSGGPKQLFHIRAPRFKCYQAHVVHVAENDEGADDGRSCFLVESGAEHDSDDALFVDPIFEMTQVDDAILGFSCIRAEGHDPEVPRRGLRVSGANFLIHEGVHQMKAWEDTSEGPVPYGICAIRCRNSAETIVADTIFRGTSEQLPRGTAGPMILLDNCPASVLSDLVFRLLNLTTDASTPSTLVRITTHGGHEGHQTVLARLFCEPIRARFVLELLDVSSDVVAFTNHGRQEPNVEAAIRVDGERGRGLVLLGSNFHNVHGPQQMGRLIDLQRISDAVIAGNVFLPFQPEVVPIHVEPDQCANVHIARAQSMALKP